MLRIHLAPDDLTRFRFLPEPSPMLELAMALMALQRRDGGVLRQHWRRSAVRTFPKQAEPLLDLVFSYRGPDFLDMLSPDFSTGLDEALSLPKTALRSSLTKVYADRADVPSWLHQLADSDPAAISVLRRALCSAHNAFLVPAWSNVRRSYHADLAYRKDVLAVSGIGSALLSLHPSIRWRDGTVEVDSWDQRDIHPRGRGIICAPSTFWPGSPLVGDFQERPLLIVYPARMSLSLLSKPTDEDPLASVLGRTRAAVLRQLSPGCTTSELAQTLGISLSSASEHATALRSASLIASEREGKAVRHRLTPLGTQLLIANAG